MFGDLNRATIIGTVVQTPELKYTTNGKPVMNITVVTNKSYKKDNEWLSIPEYHTVTVWDSAESLSKFISRGSRVYAEGRISTRSYEKDGEKRYKTEIIADNVLILDKKDNKAEEAVLDPNKLPF